MSDEPLEAWRTNNRINLYLLERISDQGLRCTLSTRGGRDVARQFGHMHDVRLWQLHKRARDLAKGLVKFPTRASPSRAQLVDALVASGEAVEAFLAALLAGEARRRGFKKGVHTTLAYFVAHESHHRGNILLTLKQCGHNLEQAERYAIWDWDRI
jgi:uncharacterized damage-inducible protein DinB